MNAREEKTLVFEDISVCNTKYINISGIKNRIPLEDRGSFKILTGGYTKDKINVYYAWKIVEGADPESFEMIGNTFGGRDKHGCFNGFDRVECL